jgi:sulfur carrier protein
VPKRLCFPVLFKVIPKVKSFLGMEITLNNKPIDVAEHATLRSLVVAHTGGAQAGIAVAVNNVVIARAEHERYRLRPNDSVLIIRATQGG